ncbi:FAD-dependent oxidoreductase [Chloroflexota bacterium]
MREIELAIIGAGPAGICAAIEAAKYNVPAVLIDENLKPGGQIYRQLSDTFDVTNEHKSDKSYLQGRKLIGEMERYRSKIELIEDAMVWGIFDSKEIAFLNKGKHEELKPQKLILAEGAYDRPMPFPGWTLPGIFTAGGTLRMVKTEMVLPGKRVLLAGTGPLQLLLATQLAQAGAEVVMILESASPTAAFKYLPKFWGQWELLKDGLSYSWELRRRKIPYLMSRAIIEARGEEEVKEAVYTKVDGDGKPIPGTEKVVEVDAICLGYGLLPSTRLSRLCGCEHRYESCFRTWLPCHDENMETNLPGVFVAGDDNEIGGALVAVEEGRLAGIEACRQLGHVSQEEAEQRSSPVFKKLKGLRRFELALNEIFSIRNGLFTRITDDTVVCRCEEVTAGEIRKIIADGTTEIQEIKRLTRVGMGHCQGRTCESTIAQMISMEMNKPVSALGYFTPRPPVKPFPLGVLAGEDT